MYITCSKTENSNGELTIEILREVIFPVIATFEGEIGGVLVDDFKGHIRDILKEYTKVSRVEMIMYQIIIDTISVNFISWREGSLQNHNHLMLSLEKCSKVCIDMILIIICFLHHQMTEDSQLHPPYSFVSHGL